MLLEFLVLVAAMAVIYVAFILIAKVTGLTDYIEDIFTEEEDGENEQD